MNYFLCLATFLLLAQYGDCKSLGQGDIIGGTEAEPGQFPFSAGMFITTANGGEFFCGGTILSENYILTAAHCLDYRDISNVEIIVGGHNISKTEPSQQRRNLKAENLKLHDDWIDILAQNDVGIIHLVEPIKLNDRVQAVTLPTWKDVKNQFIQREVIVSGWGRTQDDPPRSSVLRYVDTETITNSECNHAFGGFVTLNNICIDTYGGQRNVCGGDSGGPMFIEENGQLKQIGIASFVGPLGCSGGLPGAFVRITNFLEWIQKNSDIVIKEN